MLRTFFSPKWLLVHLFFVAMVAAMVSLGFWQLRRLDERRAYNALVEARAEEPAIALADVPADADLEDWRFRTVVAEGTYLPAPEFRLTFDSVGYDLIGLLQLEDGRVVVVDRGYASLSDPAPSLPTGPVTVTGRLQLPEGNGTGQLANATSPVLIYRLDPNALAEQVGQQPVPFVLDRISATPDDAALDVVPAPDLGEGPHFGYAVQWFLFSLGAITCWVLAIAKTANDRRRGPAAAPVHEGDGSY